VQLKSFFVDPHPTKSGDAEGHGKVGAPGQHSLPAQKAEEPGQATCAPTEQVPVSVDNCRERSAVCSKEF